MRKTTATICAAILTLSITPAFAATSSPSMPGMPGMQTMTPPPISGTAAMMGGTKFDAAMPKVISNIKLTDANGASFTMASLKGKYVVLTDFFTSCDMICPMTSVNMRDIGDAVKKAGLSKSIKVLEVTIDPQRDTVSRLKAYQALYNDSSWTVATGATTDLKNFWAWFGVYTKKTENDNPKTLDWQTGKKDAYDLLHDDVIMVIGPNGHWRWIDLGNPAVSNPTTLPSTLKNYLSTLGRVNLLKPQQPSWTPSAVFGALQEIFNLPIGSKMKM